MTATEAKKKLRSLASPKLAQSAAGFFKTGPGQYGEGDVFIGVTVPALRKLAREFHALPLPEIEALIHSEIHEERSLALLVLVHVATRGDKARQKELFDFYLANTRHVNNWDLVDCSARCLVGAYLQDRSRKPLYRLAKSSSLWERRIAIVATHQFICDDDFADTLKIAEMLLTDKEDLIHKATGWMLREVGKRDEAPLEGFLRQHAAVMPRTMLRYAIERFSPARRRVYLDRRA